MGLTALRLAHLRCIEAARLELDPQLNLICGANGAGKTTLLEAVHVLGRGRSFRGRQNARLVRRGCEAFEVRGRVDGPRACDLGVRFGRGSLEVRIDGAEGRRSSELAAILPVQVLEPEMHRLVADGPGVRRRFLDWGVFHVEQGYLEAWRNYRRALGQRNAALKSGVRGGAFAVWNQQLVEAAQRVDGARQRYLGRWRPAALELAGRLTGLTLEIEIDPGGYAAEGLAATLGAGEDRERRTGRTESGPHRADLRLRVDGAPAREAASRGQQKLIAAALILAQVEIHVTAKPGLGALLVDDPAAELDPGALKRLVAELERLPTQMLVTGITRESLEPLGDGRLFHVEHGVVTPQGV